MKPRSLQRWLLLGGAVLLASCKDAIRPDATGSIAIQVVLADGTTGAGAGSPAMPQGHLESASATASNATTTKTIQLTGGTSTSTFTGTITGLPVGTYAVTVQGMVGGQVDYFGQTTGVAVTPSSTTTATISNWSTFVPIFSGFTSPTTSFRIPITGLSAPNATSYVVEVDRSNTFPSPAKTTVTGSSGSFLVSDTGTYYVRVRAANSTVPNGGNASGSQSVSVTRDLRTSGDSVPAAPDLGFFATSNVVLDSLNIYPATDADWFSLNDCNGDSLMLTAEAVRLALPSPLNTVLLVYNAAGRLVNGNDDGDSTDARVSMVISSDGTYKVRVSGTGTSVGHYRLRIQVRAGANNTGSMCRVVPLTVTSISAGFLHTCAVRSTGNTDCWGNNADGQLGNGTTTSNSSPTKISGTQALQTVTAGRFHSCGRTSSNVAYCWGYNGAGELGDNTTTNSQTPVAVGGGQLFQYVDAGGYFTCGLNGSGLAYCWGENNLGQLGNGTNTSSSLPVPVSGGPYTSLAVGDAHACGATSIGEVYCWGANYYGQLGNGGTPISANVPVLVSGMLTLQGVVAGDNFTCARTNPGNAAYCWGEGGDGQLGDGGFSNQTTPVPVQGGLAFTALAGGQYHACGLIGTGTAYCWGNNYDGQLGDGTTIDRTIPTLVTGGQMFQAISGGSWHTCAAQKTTGDAYCWGWNGFGQNGNGIGFDHAAPVPISLGAGLKSISTNGQHSCGVATGGTAYCWGSNASGQLGDGSSIDELTPVAVSGGGSYQVVATGSDHSCALAPGSEVSCWGANGSGQLGDGTSTDHNAPLAITGAYQSVTAGGNHTCALSTTTAYCWGDNFYGEVGDGTTTDAYSPVAVAGTYAAVAAGAYHTCAVRTTGGVIDCWGLNDNGQLGDNTTSTRGTPGPVTSAQTFQSVTAGGYHTCALTTTGAAYCWGSNGSGQLGDGSQNDRSTPVAVSGGLTFQALNAGDYHTCGITTNNVLYCWGENFAGQVGNGGFSDRTAPTLVLALVAFQRVDAGGSQTCAYGTAAFGGRGYCWGNNERGQLGYGTLTIQPSPAIVVTGPSAAPMLAAAGYSAQEDTRQARRVSQPHAHRPWQRAGGRRPERRRQ